MRSFATAPDWTPLVRLNREFHLQIYSLSPYKIILDEVKRLWTLADTFIATKMSEVQARLRTVEEHDRVIDSLSRRDHAVCLEMMEEHRASTAAGLSPETQLKLSKPVRAVPATLTN